MVKKMMREIIPPEIRVDPIEHGTNPFDLNEGSVHLQIRKMVMAGYTSGFRAGRTTEKKS
jgi:hypothetical protein